MQIRLKEKSSIGSLISFIISSFSFISLTRGARQKGRGCQVLFWGGCGEEERGLHGGSGAPWGNDDGGGADWVAKMMRLN